MTDPKQLTALELLQLCLDSNDQAAWTEFVSRYEQLIDRVVRNALRSHNQRLATNDRVEDLAQDTFVKLCDHDYRALRVFHFEHENSLYGFLKVVALNVVEDWRRAYMTEKRNSGQEPEDLDNAQSKSSGESPDVMAEGREFWRMISRRLSALRNEPHYERDVTIFKLYFRYGFTAKEISEMPGIGLGVKGVESTIFRLVKFLRGGFGDSAKGGK